MKFEVSVEKIKFSLKYDKNNGTLNEDQYSFMIISRSFLPVMRNSSEKFVEKIKTHILFSIIFFSKILPLMRSFGKYRRAGQATDDNTAHARCMLDN